jgi:hypothetical protein
MMRRNTKINHFQEGRARFETTIGLYEKEHLCGGNNNNNPVALVRQQTIPT